MEGSRLQGQAFFELNELWFKSVMDVDLEFMMCMRGSVAKIMTQKKKYKKSKCHTHNY